MPFKIEVDADACIGCGACTQCENFEVKDDNKAHPKEAEVKEVGCNKEAVDTCPVNAIKITEI